MPPIGADFGHSTPLRWVSVCPRRDEWWLRIFDAAITCDVFISQYETAVDGKVDGLSIASNRSFNVRIRSWTEIKNANICEVEDIDLPVGNGSSMYIYMQGREIYHNNVHTHNMCILFIAVYLLSNIIYIQFIYIYIIIYIYINIKSLYIYINLSIYLYMFNNQFIYIHEYTYICFVN